MTVLPTRRWLWLAPAVAGAVALVRVLQAAAGSLPAARAAGEAGILVAVALVVPLAVALARSAGSIGRLLLVASLVVWSVGVAAPLWRLAHPLAVFTGSLGGARREVATPPVGRGGRHVIEVARPASRAAHAMAGAAYVLHVRQGHLARRLTGVAGARIERAEIVLAKGAPVSIWLERSEELRLEVRLRPVPLPWPLVRIAALVAALLAALADVLGWRERPRLRGLFAAAVGAASVFAALLEPEAGVGGRHALGAAGIAVLGGGLLGAVVGPLGGWLRRRRREERRTA